MNSHKPFIIGIAGGTGSGKTTIARKIVNHFKKRILHIPHDRYYKDHSHLSAEELLTHNYDHPDDLETNLLINNLEALLQGKTIELPIYNFTTHSREEKTTIAEPASLILIEGILIYENKKLRDFIDLKMFVDVPSDIRVIRKIDRDIRERGRTMKMSVDQYLSGTRPMHEKYVEPTKEFADIIIPHGGFNEKGIDVLIDAIEKRLQSLK